MPFVTLSPNGANCNDAIEDNLKRFYCTYFDKNYLVKALALLASLRRHEKNDFAVFVVCLDDIVYEILNQLSIPNVVTIALHEIEQGDHQLLKTKTERSIVEYYWTLTPTIILRLIERFKEIDVLTYLDADLFFFSSPDPIYSELANDSILIHPHRFSPALAHLEKENGTFNVGLLCFRSDEFGLTTLRWWRDRCLEWCYHRSEDGKMGDQMYLNDWPERFPQVVVLQHTGAGIAPWNHEQYRIRRGKEGKVLIDDLPLVFYHFQSFTFVTPDLVVPAKHADYPLTTPLLLHCFLPYLRALEQAFDKVRTVDPEFAYGMSTENVLTTAHTFFCRSKLVPMLQKSGDCITQKSIDLAYDWSCFVSPQLLDGGVIAPPPLMKEGERVATEDDLLIRLASAQIRHDIRVIYVIGAHLFQERELFNHIFPRLEAIYLFEPIPDLYTVLQQNLKDDLRVRVFPYAIADRNETTLFHLTNNQASSSLLPLGSHKELFPHVHEVGSIPVECRTLEHVISAEGLLPPDMLFIDVQGAEYSVLSPLSQTMREQVRLIYTEASIEPLYEGGRKLSEIKELLAPEFLYLGFSPLTNETPTHGNALFVNRLDADGMLTSPLARQSGYLVTAIVSLYEAERFIRGCLEDLIGQTLYKEGKLEIIVIDSASPQHEGAIVKEYQSSFPHIRYLRTDIRETIYAAWNRAIAMASGEFITNANTDDRHRPDALERLAKELQQHPDMALVYADCFVTGASNRTFTDAPITGCFLWPDFDPVKLFQVCFVGPQPMWRKNLHDRYGLFEPSLKSAGDYDFWLRLAAHGEKFLHLSDLLGLYLLSDEGVEHGNLQRSHNESEVARSRNWPDSWGARPLPTGSYLFPVSMGRPPVERICTGPPLVSVIVPTSNRPEMLIEALRSIQTQTYSNVEAVVINDGGKDVSHIFQQLQYPDRIVYINLPIKIERSAARNLGMRIAQGKYIAYLDDDDIFYPNHLDTLVGFLEGSDYKVAYTDAHRAIQQEIAGQFVTVRKEVSFSFDFDIDRILVENFIPILCVMHEKSCLDESGLFDESLNRHEDWDLWIRMSRHFKFAHIPLLTCEFTYRIVRGAMTGGSMPMYLSTYKIICEKYGHFSSANPRIALNQKQVLFNLNTRLFNAMAELIEPHIDESGIRLDVLLECIKSGGTDAQIMSTFYWQKAIKCGVTTNMIPLLIKSVEIYNENNPARVALVDLLLKEKRFIEAVEHLKILNQLNPLEEKIASSLDQLEHALNFASDKSPVSYDVNTNRTDNLPIAMQDKPIVSIIILCFNQCAFSKQCLNAISKSSGSIISYELILIDNGSSDETSSLLNSLTGNVTIISNRTNLGFARACNQGAKIANGRYLLFLNNDTIPGKGWLEPLVRGIESDGADISGGLLLFPNGTVQHAGIAFNEKGVGYHIFSGFPADAPAAATKRFMQAVTGACLLVKRELFYELQGFDEGYINGFEDVDLCLRAGEKGAKILYVPESRSIHFAESSEGRKSHDQQNMHRFAARWYGRIRNDDEEYYRQFGCYKSIAPDGSTQIAYPSESCAESRAGSLPNATALAEVKRMAQSFSRNPDDQELKKRLIDALISIGCRDEAQRLLKLSPSTQ